MDPFLCSLKKRDQQWVPILWAILGSLQDRSEKEAIPLPAENMNWSIFFEERLYKSPKHYQPLRRKKNHELDLIRTKNKPGTCPFT